MEDTSQPEWKQTETDEPTFVDAVNDVDLDRQKTETRFPAVDPDEDPSYEALTPELRNARWQSRRPRIDHLYSGVVEHFGERDPVTKLLPSTLLPLFDVGDRIVVEVRTALLPGSPWLHTLVGKVRSIDDETGIVSLYDEDSDPRAPAVRWTSLKDGLHDFRLAPPKGDPFTATKVKNAGREMGSLNGQAEQNGEPKRRGRPKGSKNRSKEEIAAEKAARKEAKK